MADCPRCNAKDSLNPVLVFAEIKFITMWRCYLCSELIDDQVIANRLNFWQIKKEVEKHLQHALGKTKWK